MSVQDTPRLLNILTAAQVPFIVIGGVAAIAHGASTFTRDLDVLIAFDRLTLERVLQAIEMHDPRAALDPARRAVPTDVDALTTFRNLYVTTTLGRLDFLGETPIGGYAQLASRAVTMSLAGVSVQVIALDDLIAIKRALGRPKDLLVATELEAVRQRLTSRGDRPG